MKKRKILDEEKSKVDKLNKDITTMNQILQNEYTQPKNHSKTTKSLKNN